MQRTDSLEKSLMLGKIEGGRRRGRQRMRWFLTWSEELIHKISKKRHSFFYSFNNSVILPCGFIVRSKRFSLISDSLSQFSSVIQSRLTLRPHGLKHTTPAFPVHHQLPECTQTHVYQVVMPSNHLILCRPPLLPPSIFPSIRVISKESVLCIRWQ